MSSLITGFKKHENMRIGNFGQKTMLIDFDKEGGAIDYGDIRLVVQVSYNKDDSATIAETADKSLLTIKNLADDTQMNIHNSTSGFINTYEKTINFIRKGLFMNYCGLSYDIGSYNDGIYNTQPFGATSIAIFSNAHPNMRSVAWKKFSSHGYNNAIFGISRFDTQQKLVIQFAGNSYAGTDEYIDFNFNDTTTEINYLAFASVKETATNVYLFNFELHSFTDASTPVSLVQSVSYTKVFDIATSPSVNKDHYHSGLDKYNDPSDANKSAILVFETRFYIGCIEGALKDVVINDLLDYWRCVGIDFTYQFNYQFAETIDDLTISSGSPVYHQNRMIKLQPAQLLSKTFTDNSVLTRGDNLNLLSIRVKVYSESNKFHVDGHGSWSFEFHNGELKFTDGTNEVISNISLTTQFNDFTCVVNPEYVYFYVNGYLHEAVNNSVSTPLNPWDTFDINHHANSLNIYDIVHVKLGINDEPSVIENNYKENITDFFIHNSLTASHTLSANGIYTTTLTPSYIAEPPSYLVTQSETVFTTLNSTTDISVENSPVITIPNTQNRTFNLTYDFRDGTTYEASVIDTLFDITEPNKSETTYSPTLSTTEYLLENKYRVFFHLNSTTQGEVVPIQEIDFKYDTDARLSGGTFTTTVNPITTINKTTNQTISISNYAGKLIPLGYYDFNISNRDLRTLTPPESEIRHIHQTGGTNIVNTNAKKNISRYRQPYLKLVSRQGYTRKEQITRSVFFEKQDYSFPISNIKINYHVKTNNFTLGDFFPKNSTTSTTSAPTKTGYNINQQITFTYFTPQTNLQEIFTVLTNQTTQMIYEDDFYIEIVSINGLLFPYPPSLYIEPIYYIPTIRFDYTATQVNFEIRIDITVNKNGDNVTGFRIKLNHHQGALINYNNFGVGGFTMTTPSTQYTIFTFNGNHFSGQNETLIQLIVGNDNPYEKIFDSEVRIEFETFTLEQTPTILNNPVINPTFTFNSLSTISYEEYSFTTIDDYTEKVSMNVYLNTNRDVKTALDFWLSFEDTTSGGGWISGTEEIGYTDLWNYTIVPQSQTVNTQLYQGFHFTATKIPNISDNKHPLLTVSYTRYRTKLFDNTLVIPIINSISPTTTLLPFFDPTVNEIIYRIRDRELVVRPTQSLSPNILNVDIDFFCSENNQTYDFVIEIWYNSKLTYNSFTTGYPLTYTDITVTPITGTYEGFTQGQQIHMDTLNSGVSEGGILLNLLQIKLTPANNYDEIDNSDFAVKFISSSQFGGGGLIEATTIPTFDYQVDVSITGIISEVTEGVTYELTTTINQTNEYELNVYYDIYFNADTLVSDGQSYYASLAGVPWTTTKKIPKIFKAYLQSSATQTERFEMKFYREALSDDDFRIVIRNVIPQALFPTTLFFNSVQSISTFNYFPEFQLRLSPAVSGDTITITVILEKDSRPVRNFNFNYLVDDDRTINSSLPRGELLEEGTYSITDQLGVDFTQYGYYTNTNKTTINYSTSVDGVGNGIINLPIYYFTVKRRQANYLIDKNDYATEFTVYEAFHTNTQYFNRQVNADKDEIPYIAPELYLTNVSVSTLSANNHQLSFTINHPDLGANSILRYRMFYRNMTIGGIKTTIGGNPYETPIGFVNGRELSQFASSGYTTTVTQNFQTDTSMADHITQDDFLVEILDTSYSSKGEFEVPVSIYTPSTYLEPSTYNLRTASNRDVFDVYVLNQKNFFTFSGTNIVNLRAGVRDFTNNIQITPTNAFINNGYFYNKISSSTNPLLEFPLSYDYVSNGADAMLTCVFKLNAMNSGGDIRVAGHDDIFILELESSLFPPTVAYAYIRFDGFKFNGGAEKIDINTLFYYAIKARVVETSTNNYTIDIRHWYSPTFPSSSWTEGTPINYSTTRNITNPTNNAIINEPTASFTYNLDIAQASYNIGRFTISEWNDTYFITQFDSYEGNHNSYALLDMRQQEADWIYYWGTYRDYGPLAYIYSTIGKSRAIALTQDYLFKKNFSTGSTLWGDTMRIGLIIVFKTLSLIPIEQLCLFLHGDEKSPPNHQLIVNRNGLDDSVAIELNENNGSTLQQQHLNKIDWEKPQYEYLYYAKFYQRPKPPSSPYISYDIQSKLIGLNNSTNETFNSVGLPQFLQSSSSSSTDLTANLYIGKTIIPNNYGGFSVGYMNYFEFKSEAHSAYEIEGVRRDWETIY